MCGLRVRRCFPCVHHSVSRRAQPSDARDAIMTTGKVGSVRESSSPGVPASSRGDPPAPVQALCSSSDEPPPNALRQFHQVKSYGPCSPGVPLFDTVTGSLRSIELLDDRSPACVDRPTDDDTAHGSCNTLMMPSRYDSHAACRSQARSHVIPMTRLERDSKRYTHSHRVWPHRHESSVQNPAFHNVAPDTHYDTV